MHEQNGYLVTEEMTVWGEATPGYELLPMDLLVRSQRGTFTKFSDMSSGNLTLTAAQIATLTPVRFRFSGRGYVLLGEDNA